MDDIEFAQEMERTEKLCDGKESLVDNLEIVAQVKQLSIFGAVFQATTKLFTTCCLPTSSSDSSSSSFQQV